MKASHYILDEKGEVKEEKDLMVWAKWFENNREKRLIESDVVGSYRVSTVFLGLDYNFTGTRVPILFETMVFDVEKTEIELVGRKSMIYKTLDLDGMFEQYETRVQAETGHKEIIKNVEMHNKETKNE